jgi:hypothetical protein
MALTGRTWPRNMFNQTLVAYVAKATLHGLAWVHVQGTAVEEDGHAEVIPIAIAMSMVFDFLDLGIQSFRQCVSVAVP